MKNILENIEIESEYIGNAVWRPFSSHRFDKWEVFLHRRKSDSVHVFFLGDFHLGEGNNGREPELREVIFALLSDGQAGSLSFEDFCFDFGYDTDSRRAFAVWEACKESGEKLRKIFSSVEIEHLELEFTDY